MARTARQNAIGRLYSNRHAPLYQEAIDAMNSGNWASACYALRVILAEDFEDELSGDATGVQSALEYAQSRILVG